MIFYIPLSRHIYRWILEEDYDVSLYISEAWKGKQDDDDSNYNLVSGEIEQFHQSDGGVITIFDIEIGDFHFDKLQIEGTFSFRYVVDHYFSCDDLSNQTKPSAAVNFSFDKANWRIKCEMNLEKWMQDYA